MKGPALSSPRVATVVAALHEAAQAGHGGITFVARDERERRFSWPELRARAVELAGALQRLGVVPGDRVALVMPTSPEFVATFFGVQLAGATPVPLYPPVRLGRMAEYHAATAAMIRASRARLLLASGMVRRLLGEVTRISAPELGCLDVASLDAGHFTEVPVTGDALGLIQFSSGSTSAPKPVALTHRALVHQLEMLRTLMPDVDRSNVGVSWLPLYHDMGLIGALLSAAYYPGPLSLIEPQDFLARPALWLRTLSRHRGTISPAPNFAFGLCVKRIKDEELEGVDLSRWRFALNGAEAISAELMRRFVARFSRYGFDPSSLLPVYGLSEAALAVTFSDRRAQPRIERVDGRVFAREGRVSGGDREVVSVGVPVPGTEVSIRNELGHEVEEGIVGRIFVRSASLMQGYDGLPDVTGETLRDGWLDTGDLGFVRAGELFVFGRAKDVIILRGANRAPQEFEDAVDSVEGVRTGCAVAVGFLPEGSQQEALLILAEVADDASPELEQKIRVALSERTGEQPHTVLLLEPGTLPRTSSGKLRRSEALRRYLSGELTAPKPVNALTMGGELLKSAIGYLRAERR